MHEEDIPTGCQYDTEFAIVYGKRRQLPVAIKIACNLQDVDKKVKLIVHVQPTFQG